MNKNNLEIYSGNWNGDSFSGKGRYIYSNGDIYTGEINNNLKEGNGVY